MTNTITFDFGPAIAADVGLTLQGSNIPLVGTVITGARKPRKTKDVMWCDTATGRIRKFKGGRWKAVGRFVQHELVPTGDDSFTIPNPAPNLHYRSEFGNLRNRQRVP